MEQALLYNDLTFTRVRYSRYHHNDAGGGNPCHYFGYMQSGSGRLVTKDTTVTVTAGDVFFIPKHLSYHSYWHVGTEVTVFSSLGFAHFPEAERRHYPLQILPGPYPADLIETILKLDAGAPVTSAMVGDFYRLVAALLPCMVTVSGTERDRLAEQAVAWFRQHPHGTAAEAAAHCGISESGLYVLFRQVFHQTPVTVKQQLLLQQATELLTTTDLPIEEISRRLGFSSASYFRKILRRHTGQTPRELRRTSLL